MTNRMTWFFMGLTMICMAAVMAAAQSQVPVPVPVPVPAPAPGTEDPQWLMIVLLLIPPLMGFVSTIVPSGSVIMKIVDALAFNWGRARNDPSRQR